MPTNEIGYVDTTWNPFIGCSPVKISCGCNNCWALRMTMRLIGASKKVPALRRYRALVCKNQYRPGRWWSGETLLVKSELSTPSSWRKTTRRVAVSFMGDIALARVGEMLQILAPMSTYNRHTYLMLTKRPGSLGICLDLCRIGLREHANLAGPNVWWGLSACEEDELAGVPELVNALRYVPSRNLYLSIEPMLGPMDIRPWLKDIRWVIIGAETGPGAREFRPQWAESVVGACARAGVPVWMKGKSWDGIPALRQIPKNDGEGARHAQG